MAAVIGRVLRQAGDQRAGAQVIADLIGGHLRDAVAIQHRLQHQVGVVEGQHGGRRHLAQIAPYLELPFIHAPRRQAEIHALVLGDVVNAGRQAVLGGIGGRRAQQHLHGDHFLGDHLAVFHAAIAKRHVNAVRREIGGAVIQQQFHRDPRIGFAKLVQQRRDDLAAETHR
ncbi:hypothetical protein D3C73_1221870 [compost metagenome]